MGGGDGEDCKGCHGDGEEDKDAGEEDIIDGSLGHKAFFCMYDEEESKEEIPANYLSDNMHQSLHLKVEQLKN